MIEEQVLKDLGLTQAETKVYLACLELGVDSVLHITKKAGIKRPTCYLILDNLFEKGFVTKIEKKNTTLYSAESPKKILTKYKERVANFADLVPYFEAKWNKGPKPQIRYYEGKDELWEVYTKILFPSKEIYFFGADVKKIIKVFPDMYEYFKKHYLKNTNKVMEIVSYDEEGVDYVKQYGSDWPIRAMPKDLPVLSDSVITENRLFVISLDNLFGVLIESTDLAQTYKNFFLLAWRAAEDVK